MGRKLSGVLSNGTLATSDSMKEVRGKEAVVVKTNGIPFWLVGEFTTHFRTYFLMGIGMFTGGTGLEKRLLCNVFACVVACSIALRGDPQMQQCIIHGESQLRV